MGLVVCDGGCGALLRLIRDAAYTLYYVRLYQNDRTPGRSDTSLMYVEAEYSGYPGPVMITAWSAVSLSVHVATIRAALISYTRSAGVLSCYVFGYYVTDGAGNLVWAERLPGNPAPMFSVGDTVAVTPTLTLTSDLP